MSTTGAVTQITESIGQDFDGNRDGALKGVEKWAFLTELRSQLGAAGTGLSVSGADSVLGTSGADQLDLSQVVWLHENVSGWPQTSTITSTSIGDPPISIDHTKSGLWPAGDFTPGGVIVEANAWVFANVDGTWYAATWEWLRPGQTTKNLGASDLKTHAKVAPLNAWTPQSGEQVGLMVSTPARLGPAGPVRERSNVVLTTWP